MIRNSISRATLGMALAAAGIAAVGVSAPAFAAKPAAQPAGPKIEFSKEFRAVAGELDKTLADGVKNPAVTAASQQARAAGQNAAAKAAAVAQVDAALGGAKAKLDAAGAAASTPGDRLKLGEMRRTYGVLTDDTELQYAGLTMMIESGLLPAASLGQVQWLAGVAAYQKRDFANAAKYAQQAKDGGYQDPQLDAVLSDAYKRSNNPAAAMQMAQRDIAAAKAAGTKASEGSIRTALQAAYDAKQAGPTAEYAVLLVQGYPSSNAWNVAINVVRATASYQVQETLDLMRLMARTNSYASDRDYIEYIQAADARRFPGEVAKVIEAGTASGKLKANDPFVAESRTIATGRIAADQRSLPALERDARAPNAPVATVAAAADTFLSYGDAAKAVDLYTIAVSKPGGDVARLNTRLGIAQIDKGDYAGAQVTLAKVQGPRATLAKLWSAYAAQKAAGK
ncbi:MAG: hypothetical protein JWQ16_3002 [Novosphingobium sp.]|nr:hypothetical protein [Novosphingobium sp.]